MRVDSVDSAPIIRAFRRSRDRTFTLALKSVYVDRDRGPGA
jgi:hypothetical protein